VTEKSSLETDDVETETTDIPLFTKLNPLHCVDVRTGFALYTTLFSDLVKDETTRITFRNYVDKEPLVKQTEANCNWTLLSVDTVLLSLAFGVMCLHR